MYLQSCQWVKKGIKRNLLISLETPRAHNQSMAQILPKDMTYVFTIYRKEYHNGRQTSR